MLRADCKLRSRTRESEQQLETAGGESEKEETMEAKMVLTVTFDEDEAMPWGDLRDDIVGAVEDFNERERPRTLNFDIEADEDLPREGDDDDEEGDEE